MEQTVNPAPEGSLAGTRCERRVKFSREQIAQFASLTGDINPVHTQEAAARRARHGRIIASGQQTAAQMIGLAASHCAQAQSGQVHEVLCLNFNFSFKAPVFADSDLDLQWTVGACEPSERLGGSIWHLDGTAVSDGRVCVVGRGTVLVKPLSE